jgi:hypothetical protein
VFRLKEIVGIKDIKNIASDLRYLEKRFAEEINAQVKKYGYCDNLTPTMHYHVKRAAETLERINKWPEKTIDDFNKS